MNPIVQKFYKAVDEGRENKNHSVSIGLPKLEEYIEGLNQGASYILAGASGSGKKHIK